MYQNIKPNPAWFSHFLIEIVIERVFTYLRILLVSVKMKLILLISISHMIQFSLSQQNFNHTNIEPRDDHSFQKIWIANSVIGVFGIILNSLVLLIFFQERTKLVTSVNAMIM